MFDGKPPGWPWVQNPEPWPIGLRQHFDPVPCRAIFLRPAAQCAQPQLLEAVHEHLEMREAGWNRIVVQPTIQDSSKPSGRLMNVAMHPPMQCGLDAREGPVDPLRHRFAPQAEVPLSRGPAAMRKSEEGERLRWPLSPLSAVSQGGPAKFDGTGLAGVKLG